LSFIYVISIKENVILFCKLLEIKTYILLGANKEREKDSCVHFLCFVRFNSFWAVSGALHPIFIFYAPGFFFDIPDVVSSNFHILRSQIYFWHSRGHCVHIWYFACQDSFWAVPSQYVYFSSFTLSYSFSAISSHLIILELSAETNSSIFFPTQCATDILLWRQSNKDTK
jgi:hypothetical protein